MSSLRHAPKFKGPGQGRIPGCCAGVLLRFLSEVQETLQKQRVETQPWRLQVSPVSAVSFLTHTYPLDSAAHPSARYRVSSLGCVWTLSCWRKS